MTIRVLSLISMAQLIVRNLEKRVVSALRARAARNGRSAEEEHRHILREALFGRRPRRNLKDLIRAMPNVGKDSDFARRSDRGRKVRL